MIGRTLAARLAVGVGDPLVLVKDGDKRTLRIKGVIDAGDASDSLLFINLPLATCRSRKRGSRNRTPFRTRCSR